MHACTLILALRSRLECPRFHRYTRGLKTITAVTTTAFARRSEVLSEIITRLLNVQPLATRNVQWTRGMSRLLLGHTNRGSATASSRYPAESRLGETLSVLAVCSYVFLPIEWKKNYGGRFGSVVGVESTHIRGVYVCSLFSRPCLRRPYRLIRCVASCAYSSSSIAGRNEPEKTFLGVLIKGVNLKSRLLFPRRELVAPCHQRVQTCCRTVATTLVHLLLLLF